MQNYQEFSIIVLEDVLCVFWDALRLKHDKTLFYNILQR